jgi:hypothetical protein
LGVASFVGVLNAEDKLAAAVTRVEPVEKGRTSPAYMQVTGRRGSKSDADFRIHRNL